MFKYTRFLFNETVEDVRRLYRIFTISTQVIYIAYLIAALIIPLGYPIANACLLPLSVGYFIFFIVSLTSERFKSDKTAKTRVKKYYTFLKNIIQLGVIAASVYDIIISEDGKYISVKMLITALMVIFFIAQITLQIITSALEKRFALFVEALKADLEFITNPIEEGKNFKRALLGEDPIKKKDPTDARIKLEKMYAEERVEDARADNEKTYEAQMKVARGVRYIKGLFKKKEGKSADTPEENGSDKKEKVTK